MPAPPGAPHGETHAMNETRPKGHRLLHWLTWNWHRALIGLAIGVFVIDLIGPEILAKPFLCRRAENGKHVYITVPESYLGANWQEVWKAQASKECAPQPGWDTCFFDGPGHIAKYQVDREPVFWSITRKRAQLEDLSGRLMASDVLYYVKSAWLTTLIFPDMSGGMLCEEMKKRLSVSDLNLTFLDVVQKGK
jgi:hypothetical protein